MVVAAAQPLAFKPGSIVRIRMHNFLTYADAEVRPGPRLNVVVGPNGSGKSTILCAIALGLGSQATALERGDGVGCFVMRDKEKGWVEIELKGKKAGDHNIVIRRDLERVSNKTSYRMDGKPVTQALVVDTIKALGIQINNLCTFLPQEKVGKFTEMDPQRLLIETEKVVAMGDFDLHATHEKLIEMQRGMKTCDRDKDQCQDELERLETQRASMQGAVQDMEDRQKTQVRADTLEKCLRWLIFRADQNQARDLKEEKQLVEAQHTAAQATLQPYTQRAERFRGLVKASQKALKDTEAPWTKARDKTAKCGSKIEDTNDELNAKVADLEAMDQIRRNKQRDRDRYQLKLDQLLNAPPVNVEELKQQVAEVNRKVRQAHTTHENKRQEVDGLKRELRDSRMELEQSEKQLADMKNQESQRYRRFRSARISYGRDACEAYEWVQKNKANFQGRVFGPIALEISLEGVAPGEKHAKAMAAMVELHLPQHMMTSFVVENDHDKNMLIHEFIETRKKKITVQRLHERWQQDLRKDFYSAENLQKLAPMGVKGVMASYIKGPDQVLSALRTQSNVHRVLIGDQTTEERVATGLLDRLCEEGASGPAAMQGGGGGGGGGGDDDERGGGTGNAVVYTHRRDDTVCQHRAVTSRYSGKTSIMSKGAFPPTILCEGGGNQEEEQDQERLVQELTERLVTLKARVGQLQGQARDREEEHDTAGREAAKLEKEKARVNTQIKDATNRQENIKRNRRELEKAEADLAMDEGEDRAAKEKAVRDSTRSYLDAVLGRMDCAVALLPRWEAVMEAKVILTMVQPLTRAADTELAAQSERHNELQQLLEEKTTQFRALMDRIRKDKEALTRDAPVTGDNPNTKVVDMLGGELNGKTADDCEVLLHVAREKLNGTVDNPEVIQQYQRLTRDVAKLSRKLATLTATCNDGQGKLDTLAKTWTDALRPLVDKLHIRFSEYMRQMECEGEVTLTGDPQDYEGWGLVLRVKFRDETSLQPLQAKVQSGGERSVSTILFLMGLQSCVASPFRAVDEINQGMDERNERLVFSRIVANSANVQYFLVTPKLLPGLTAMEMAHVTVLFVFNAPELLPFDKWDVKKFIEAIKRKRLANGGGGGGGGSGPASKRSRSTGGGGAANARVTAVDDDDEDEE